MQHDVGGGQESIDELIVRGEAHDRDGLDETRVPLFKGGKGLVEDDGSIGIVHGTVTTAEIQGLAGIAGDGVSGVTGWTYMTS